LKLFAKYIPGLGDRGKSQDEEKKSNGMEAIAA
jgi:symplekin